MLDIDQNNIFFQFQGPCAPLFKAAQGGHKEVVQILLDRGADPNKTNSWGKTPLHGAVMQLNARKGHKEVVQLLLNRGANPNTNDHHGISPLGHAAKYKHTILVQLLLDAGADPNQKNNDGDLTPLHYASSHGYKDIVQLLLDRGACPKMQTRNTTPLILARAHDHKEVVKIIKSHRCTTKEVRSYACAQGPTISQKNRRRHRFRNSGN